MQKRFIGLSTAVICGLGLVSLSFGQTAPWTRPLETQMYQEIPYVSGGVGLDERTRLEEIGKDKNLKLSFALTTGEYLGRTEVRIQDSSGTVVFDAVSQGPLLFATLPAGHYTVQATALEAVRQQEVRLQSGRQSWLRFYWPAQETAARPQP